MQHASDNWWVAGLVIVLSVIILVRVILAQHGRVPSIRRIAGLNAIDEAVGRATEMGRPVLMVPGLGGLGVETLQAISVFGHIARSVAKFGNRILLPTADAQLTGVAEETIREAYADAGRPELFDVDDVRYLTSEQFAFAAGTAGLMHQEKVAASFLFGLFYAESLILAETGQQVGAIQVAGTPNTDQIPFFIAACDYVIIGDEYYAASAYLSRNPTLLGSLAGQDYCKVILLAIVLIGVICTSIMAAQPTGAQPTGILRAVNWYLKRLSI